MILILFANAGAAEGDMHFVNMNMDSSINPSEEGKPVTFTVTLTHYDPLDTHSIEGYITFCEFPTGHYPGDDPTPGGFWASAKINEDGVASVTTSSLPVGSHWIVADYYGYYYMENQAYITQNVKPVIPIPEFPSVTLPVVVVLGLVAIIGQRKERRKE